MIDAQTFGQELAEIVKRQLAPILSRMDALEKRFDELPTPRDGKDADLGEVRRIIADEVQGLKTALENLKVPELPDIPAIVAEEVEKAVSGLPVPQDGKSVTVEDVAPLITSEVERQIKQIPIPKDGEPGKDGIGLAGAFIDRDGELVITLTNGEVKKLGPVVGKDGQGKDGADGLGFDDMEAVYDGEKTITLKFVRGERVKEFAFTLPVVIDRGIYTEGKTYSAGDGVTWGGSFWIAQKETSSKPGEGGDWRLAVKKGRDGRDGVVKEAKPAGPVRVGVPAKAVQ